MTGTEGEGLAATAKWLLLPGGLALVAVGFFVPWIELRPAGQGVSCTAWDLPILGWFGSVWAIALAAVVLLTRFSSSAVIAVAAAAGTGASALAATATALVVWRTPHRFPTAVIPSPLRSHASTLRSGPGLAVVATGCVLLAVWSARQAAIQLAVRRLIGPGTPGTGDLVGDEDIWGPSAW